MLHYTYGGDFQSNSSFMDKENCIELILTIVHTRILKEIPNHVVTYQYLFSHKEFYPKNIF